MVTLNKSKNTTSKAEFHSDFRSNMRNDKTFKNKFKGKIGSTNCQAKLCQMPSIVFSPVTTTTNTKYTSEE